MARRLLRAIKTLAVPLFANVIGWALTLQHVTRHPNSATVSLGSEVSGVTDVRPAFGDSIKYLRATADAFVSID